MTRVLPLALLTVFASCAELPCLPLSPECARADAELQVEVIHIPEDVRLVRAVAGGTVRESSRFTADRTVTLLFYDLDPSVEVRVELSGARELRCEATSAATGQGRSVTVDMRTAHCPAVGEEARDAGVEDAGGARDAGEQEEDGGEDEEQDGGNADGGIQLLLLSERLEQGGPDGGALRTEVVGSGFIVLQFSGGEQPSMPLSVQDFQRIAGLALDQALWQLLEEDGPCAQELPEHQLRLVTTSSDGERDVAGCQQAPVTLVIVELARLRSVYFP